VFSYLTVCFCCSVSSGIYSLSLHDALPIYSKFLILNSGFFVQDVKAPSHGLHVLHPRRGFHLAVEVNAERARDAHGLGDVVGPRSEEHTSELQSRENLVCRLLLEKKKTKQD